MDRFIRVIEKCKDWIILSVLYHRIMKVGTPFGCPLCDVLFADQIDLMAFHQYGCCSECSYGWAQPNIEKWNDGWRPNKRSVQKTI